jgi:hypothetical protein
MKKSNLNSHFSINHAEVVSRKDAKKRRNFEIDGARRLVPKGTIMSALSADLLAPASDFLCALAPLREIF